RLTRFSRSSRPLPIFIPRKMISTVGIAMPSTTTSRRSRGVIDSHLSRILSVNSLIAGSHARRGDRQLEPALALGAGLARAAGDVGEALDVLERGGDRVDALVGLGLGLGLDAAAEVELLLADVELGDVDRQLVARWQLGVDLEQEV